MVKRYAGGKAMHDEQSLYRVQWPSLCQHLHRLCLGRHKAVLLDALCHGCEPCAEYRVTTSVQAWQQAILDELAQYTYAPDAWPGWEALIPLFGDTEHLCQAISSRGGSGKRCMASSAPWPSPGDYSATIQNPHHCRRHSAGE
jgi:hypothetical protein